MAIASFIDFICMIYGLAYFSTRYTGDYTNNNASLPLVILGASFGLKFTLNCIYIIGIIR